MIGGARAEGKRSEDDRILLSASASLDARQWGRLTRRPMNDGEPGGGGAEVHSAKGDDAGREARGAADAHGGEARAGDRTMWRRARASGRWTGLRKTCVLPFAALLLGALASATAAEHLIAAVATKGSPHQPYGAEVTEGAAAAAERINAAGGVLGERLRVVAWSEDCSRERARQIAEEVARLKPVAVVGHVCAGAALAAAPIYARAGVLLIAPGVRHPGLAAAAGPLRLVLRLAGRDDRFAADTARFVAARYPGAAVALIADRTQQARGLAAATATELARRKIAVPYDERIESSQKSYDPIAARIHASGAGVVIMPAQPIELGILAESLRKAGVNAPFVGSEILAVPGMRPIAEREGARLVVMLPWSGTETAGEALANRSGSFMDADHARLAARLRAEAAIEIWAAAAQRAGSPEPSKVATAARADPMPTVLGPMQFDADGDVMVPSYIPHVWREGGWRPLPEPK